MKVPTRRATALLLATGMFALSGTALATNGYFTHGVGPVSKGMAGTGVGSNADMGARGEVDTYSAAFSSVRFLVKKGYVQTGEIWMTTPGMALGRTTR